MGGLMGGCMADKPMGGDWHQIAVAGGTLRVLPQWAGQVDAQDFNPTNPALQASKVSAGGRQSAWVIQGAYGRGVLRHYRRGGLVARVVKDQYLWLGDERSRALREADCLNWMHARGLPVPRAVAAACWRKGLFYRAAIIVEYLPDVIPLALRLEHPQAVAQAIFAMHEAGVRHADLNAFNILLDAKDKVWLIDFDRARRMAMTAAHRQANLHRLRRSLVKVAGQDGAAFWALINQFYRTQAQA